MIVQINSYERAVWEKKYFKYMGMHKLNITLTQQKKIICLHMYHFFNICFAN